jgi:hypothetical protein
MKTQFNKASRTDGTLVTLNLAQLDEEFDIGRKYLFIGDIVFVTIDGNEIQFKVNRVRDGRAITATTYCFPRYLRLPQVGRPVFAEVTEVY